jgi:hypothetical protein
MPRLNTSAFRAGEASCRHVINDRMPSSNDFSGE